MPIYEYLCERCEKRTEAIQRMDEPPLERCPHCDGPLRKLMSAPAFQFKGTGWYVTDYAGKDKPGAKSSSSSAGNSSGSAKGESSGGGDSAKESTAKSSPEAGSS